MVFEICRRRRTQNYLLSNRFLEEVKQNALLMIGHLFLTLELLCLAVTFLLFFIGQICELLKPVGIFLWKHCLKRNHFQNKNWWEKFLVLLKWTNKETKPCKGQIIISVWFTITVGPNAFVCELGWEPKISFASVDETWIFLCKTKKKSFSGLFLTVQTFGFPNNANSYVFSTEMGGHGHTNTTQQQLWVQSLPDISN